MSEFLFFFKENTAIHQIISLLCPLPNESVELHESDLKTLNRGPSLGWFLSNLGNRLPWGPGYRTKFTMPCHRRQKEESKKWLKKKKAEKSDDNIMSKKVTITSCQKKFLASEMTQPNLPVLHGVMFTWSEKEQTITTQDRTGRQAETPLLSLTFILMVQSISDGQLRNTSSCILMVGLTTSVSQTVQKNPSLRRHRYFTVSKYVSYMTVMPLFEQYAQSEAH